MDSHEWNKIFGAVLGAAFVVLGLTFLAEGIYHPQESDPSTVLDLPEAVVMSAGGAAPAGPEPILAMLASAEAAAGESVAKKCTACHVFEKGGQNKVGPHLYGVVGRPIGAVGDFGYSGALKEYAAADGGRAWTYQEMNGFLWKPKAHIKGTAMGFAGLRKPEERAAIIAWMNSQSDTPLPPPDEAAIAAEAKPAEGEEAKSAEGEKAGEGAVTPAANKTGEEPTAENAVINADPETPGATVAPAGANALGEDGKAAPAEAAPTDTAPAAPAEGTVAPTTEGAVAPADGEAPTAEAEPTPAAEPAPAGETKTVPITPPADATAEEPAEGAATPPADAPADASTDDGLGEPQTFRPKVEVPTDD